jgi:hypothetical protein
LTAGRWDGTAFESGQDSVTAVNFFILPVSDANSADFNSQPWTPLGSGVFNASDSIWQLSVPTSALTDPAGYVLRAQFLDPNVVLGPDNTDPPGTYNGASFALSIPEPAALTLGMTAVLPGMGLLLLRRRLGRTRRNNRS